MVKLLLCDLEAMCSSHGNNLLQKQGKAVYNRPLPYLGPCIDGSFMHQATLYYDFLVNEFCA